MTKGFYNLTSAMLTQGKYLDVISNNMTNVATNGYKADRYTFSTFGEVMWQKVGNKYKEYQELGQQSWITAPSQLYVDFSQGALEETGQPLDFAIEGDGWFAIQTTDGNRVYTRNGNFSLDEGRVLGASGAPIQLVTDKIESDGFGGLYTESGGFLGRIGVFTFEDNEAALERNDQGLFDAGMNGQQAAVTVRQRMLERANTDLVQQMTEMIAAQRAYQSAAEVIQIYDDVINRVTNEVGRLQ